MFKYKQIIPKKAINWLLLGLGIFHTPQAIALNPLTDVGVIRSRENAQQWSEIVARLEVLGVDYCVLDNQDWDEAKDLENLKVLLIPSVGNISGEQVLALNNWVNGGGKIVVAGPTGMLSEAEVKEQLKTIFGAYWGYSVSRPSTLIVEEPALSFNNQLSSNIVGGVVIPTNLNSETPAVWVSDGQPPAVVMNDNATFLGWRWGVDNVSSVNFDTAWLNIALKRYGVNTLGNIITSYSDREQPCLYPQTQPDDSYPLIPDLNSSNPDSGINQTLVQKSENKPNITVNQLPETNNRPTPPAPNLNLSQENNYSPSPATLVANARVKSQGFSNQEIAKMAEELEELIYRVESTLIAAEAKHLKYGLPMTTVVEQIIKNPSPSSTANKTTNQTNIKYGNKAAHQAILEAKEVLAKFPQLAAQNYPQARQLWLDARRNLWDKYPIDRYFAQPEIRSIWLDRGTIVKARSKQDLTQLFDRMQEAGINTVFFETVNASYPIYPSRVAPQQNPLTRGWDPLQAAIELAHERNMELHAWVWVFAAANEGHNAIINKPDNYLGPVLSRNPDWALKDQNGNLFNKTPGFKKAFFDPANPEVRRYLAALYEEIVTRYDVDGIQLDYIRYPFQDDYSKQTFGYTDISRQLFKQTRGIDPVKLSSSSPQWSQWTGFRVQQVDSFVADISQRLKRKRPDLIVSAAVFPMERQQRLIQLQQNWEEWIYKGWVDVMVLMTYALHTGSFEDRTQSIYDYSETSSSLILPGIRLLNVPDTETVDKMQLLRSMPTGGYALFAAENFNPNLQLIFKQTQGLSTKKEDPIPYREPFAAVSNRYRALQKEWNFLLIHHQIVVESRYLKEWSRESDALATKFKKLAANPSQRNFLAAQSALASFRNKLNTWTRKHEQEQPLQVESWENRLVALENLLKYGQRIVLGGNSSLAKQ